MADQPARPKSNPSAPEIYADRATSVTLRGNVARITFVSDRLEGDTQDAVPVVSGHAAMSVRGFVQMFAQMQSVVQQMEANGLLRRSIPGEAAASAPSGKAAKTPASRGKPKRKTAAKTSQKRSSPAKN